MLRAGTRVNRLVPVLRAGTRVNRLVPVLRAGTRVNRLVPVLRAGTRVWYPCQQTEPATVQAPLRLSTSPPLPWNLLYIQWPRIRLLGRN